MIAPQAVAPVRNETVACGLALLNSTDAQVRQCGVAVHEIRPAAWLPIFTTEVECLLSHPTLTIERALQTTLDMLSEKRVHPDWRAARRSLGGLVIAAPPAKRLRLAMQAATATYASTGRMLDAALAYASWGLPVFPVDVKSKVPIPRRDPDPTGEFKDGIPGTGGVYKATTDANTIRAWWTNRSHLIALPMGEKTGVWALDVDTPEDHEDGATAWNDITSQHPPIKTREHRSATDGPHLLFTWDASKPVGCSSGDLPVGIEVKGQGGYIVAPPSRRKGRAYIVYNDIDSTAAPRWLFDLILKGRSAPLDIGATPSMVPVKIDELADAMLFVPNDDLSWDEWTNHGLALIAASGGSERGFELFDAFSQQSNKYDAATTCERWEEMKGSPPNRTGGGKLFAIARANGWLRKAAPTYSVDGQHATPDEARRETRRIVREFLHNNIARPDSNVWFNYALHIVKEFNPPAAWGIRIPTGVGKTQITVKEIAEWVRDAKGGPVIYAVPRHKLGRKIEEQFTAHGLNARVFRGRKADDPENPGTPMCLNLPAVELALRCHDNVTAACCRHKKQKCRYFDRCGYRGRCPPKVRRSMSGSSRATCCSTRKRYSASRSR
jgi:Bifunctional DNA primase/polymerase, N-terminal/Primase C terminal 2 (PriCT-2)